MDFCVYYVTVLWFTHLVSFLNVINCCYLATMCLSFEVFLQYEGVVGLSVRSSDNSSSPQDPQQARHEPQIIPCLLDVDTMQMSTARLLALAHLTLVTGG